VHTFYTAQTLDQMRNATPISLNDPPERVPLFVPGCGGWEGFQQAVQAATISTFER
jgi:4-phytase/acid phosphatase